VVQEVWETHPGIREACDASISGHVVRIEADIAEAVTFHGIRADRTAQVSRITP
jgi:TetR/AcrR family transcriptional repressor of nem operon